MAEDEPTYTQLHQPFRGQKQPGKQGEGQASVKAQAGSHQKTPLDFPLTWPVLRERVAREHGNSNGTSLGEDQSSLLKHKKKRDSNCRHLC